MNEQWMAPAGSPAMDALARRHEVQVDAGSGHEDGG